MNKPYKISLFIFRRDLRLVDNTGLNNAFNLSERVIPLFIFDPHQVADSNRFKSSAAIQFMIHSLEELNNQLESQGSSLSIFYGQPDAVINKLIQTLSFDAVFVNKDYTPFSIQRDLLIKQICVQHNKTFISGADILLNEPEQITSLSHTPYALFTPFFKKALIFPVRSPEKTTKGVWYPHKIPENQGIEFCKKILPRKIDSLLLYGGRKEALAILKNINSFENYSATHNYPRLFTTHLSAHLKFGTVSIREVYQAITQELGQDHPLIRQLYWRDFFYHTAYHSPFVFGHAFQQKYDRLSWKNDVADFQRWCTGTTGFPIVDAGMRELNQTGFMHNRVRMIVGSFLTKDLHIDWKWGEQYFAQKLIDYDPAVNNGNWQWVASTGSDFQPYFRILNPWLQQKRFDVDCVYIKRWIPELKILTSKQIHELEKKEVPETNYPRPMVNHAQESALAKLMYK